MDNDDDVIQNIKKQKYSFAEAFPNISFQEKNWGFYFDWENSTHYLTNFAMIISDPDNGVNEIMKWLKKDSERKIAILIELENQFLGLEKQYQLGLYYRKTQKISSPILRETGIKYQSYRTMDKDMNLQDSMNVFSDIENIPEANRLEFHRFIGGYMHLFEGVIWTLDNDGSILSAALTSELEDMKDTKFINLLSTREKVRQQGHGKSLLQSILAFNKNINFISLVKKTTASTKLLESFGFKEIKTFNVYK